mmetsp:Transcript_59746/g.159899  ORF Transcript_59746/g.159899 Transcript_59746/m.159899 type:complete len:266 (-) Transcript_59746:277-1074(-)
MLGKIIHCLGVIEPLPNIIPVDLELFADCGAQASVGNGRPVVDACWEGCCLGFGLGLGLLLRGLLGLCGLGLCWSRGGLHRLRDDLRRRGDPRALYHDRRCWRRAHGAHDGGLFGLCLGLATRLAIPATGFGSSNIPASRRGRRCNLGRGRFLQPLHLFHLVLSSCNCALCFFHGLEELGLLPRRWEHVLTLLPLSEGHGQRCHVGLFLGKNLLRLLNVGPLWNHGGRVYDVQNFRQRHRLLINSILLRFCDLSFQESHRKFLLH